MYDAYLVGLTCLFHAFSAGVCWRARRVAGLRTARCAANCADLCAASCAARSAEPCEAVCSLFKKRKQEKEKIAPSGKKAGTDRFYFRIKGNLFFTGSVNG